MQMYICMRACISTPNSATLTRTTSAAFRSEETRDREITLDPFPGLDIYIYIYAFIRNFCEKFLCEILERNFLLFSYRSSFFVVERLRRIEVERRGKKLKQVRNLRKWLERVSREDFQGLRIIFFFFFLSLFLLDTTRKKNLEVSYR